MLVVLFQLGKDRYAIHCKFVVEIVPSVALRAVPNAPAAVAGLFNYRSAVVPVIDLCQLTQNRRCAPYLSSRIILVDYRRAINEAARPHQTGRILGLLAERVTEVCEKPAATTEPPVRPAGAPYLGEIFTLGGELIQCVNPAALLPEELREMLFARPLLAGQEG